MSSNVPVAEATTSEAVLPERVQEAMGQLVAAARLSDLDPSESAMAITHWAISMIERCPGSAKCSPRISTFEVGSCQHEAAGRAIESKG